MSEERKRQMIIEASGEYELLGEAAVKSLGLAEKIATAKGVDGPARPRGYP